MVPCIWYASKIAHPWERAMIGNMGAALRARGVGLSIYTDGGTTDFCLDGVLSWRALTLLERMRLILSSAGALWHLWGKAPRWWGLVRVRSRTVHTSWLPDPAWRGHPSRIFTEQADDGETVVKPTFESRLVHTEESAGVPPDGSRAVYVKLASASAPLREAIAALNCPVVDLGMGRVGASAAKSGCFISGDGPSEALHAAALTMQGLAVVGPDTPYLHSLLGDEGYFSVGEDREEAWRGAISQALSDRGRALAISARHAIKTRYSAAECADSLEAMYRSVLEGSV